MTRGRIFTLQEANAEVPRLTMLLEQLQRCALRLEEERSSVAAARGVAPESLTGEDLARWRPAARARMEELAGVVQEIERAGVLLKDIELGLIDFRAEMDGEPALLCWQFGEPEVTFWHREGEGFAGRRPIAGTTDTRTLQ